MVPIGASEERPILQLVRSRLIDDHGRTFLRFLQLRTARQLDGNKGCEIGCARGAPLRRDWHASLTSSLLAGQKSYEVSGWPGVPR